MDLIPGERLLKSVMANLVVDRGDYGLGPFPLVGFVVGRVESIGGKVHLTNYRLVFRAHALNRLRGEMSLLLPAIKRVCVGRFTVRRAVEVTSASRTHKLLPWRTEALAAAIEQARHNLMPADIAHIRTWLTGTGGDLRVNPAVAAATEALRIGLRLHSGTGLLSGLTVQDALAWLAGRQNPFS